MTDADPEIAVTPASVLAGLSDGMWTRLASESQLVVLEAGRWLFREGDASDQAYLVVSGRLEVVIEQPTEIVIRQLKRGAVVGELGLVRHGPRTASVRARRDSVLRFLSRERFEYLVREAPDFALALIRGMGDQLAANRAPETAPTAPRTIAVVGLGEGAPVDSVAAGLASMLGRHGSLAQLGPDEDRRAVDYPAVLETAESDEDRVLLIGGSPDPDDKWTNFCISEADVVLALTRGDPHPAWLRNAAKLRGCELLAFDSPVSEQLLAALVPRDVSVMHGEQARAQGIAVVARRLVGRSVGLVLSGGGARAMAHLGVLDELEEAGIVVDRLAGASMGAIVSGLSATGRSADEVAQVVHHDMVESNPSNDYTLPAYSLIRGRKTRRGLEAAFGNRRIEELPRRWYCVSSDLASRELVVHRTGPMVDAVYASMAIPGIFPPVSSPDGRLLVDGGVIDNLPVGPMARAGEGPVIAVDVSLKDARMAAARPRMQALARVVRRAATGTDRPLPRLTDTIMRTITVGSADTVAAAMRHADVVISPQVDGVGMLDWKQMDKAREIGRQAARAALEPVLADLRP
ncbi:MAG: patatin-like phospholipase family protein [Solirubrobacteraceae bacterium]